MSDRTIIDLFRHAAEMPRDEHFIHHAPPERRAFSTAVFTHRTAALAGGLEKLGVGPRNRVLLASENRPEWHMVDLAVLDLGAVDVPVYPTLTRAQIAYQARDSGARVAVAETADIATRILAVRDECPALTHVIQIEGAPVAGAVALDEVVTSGEADGVEEAFWHRASSLGPDDLATIVYTSGTTGDPKGVMLTHGNFVSNVAGVRLRVPTDRSDTVLEFLPLCHVFERCAGYSYMTGGATQTYCSVADVGEVIALARPTFFCSVPRVYEKVHARIDRDRGGLLGDEAEDLPLGRGHGMGRWRGCAWPASPSRPDSPAGTASPTGSSSPRSATPSGAAFAPPCPAPRLSPATSTSSSHSVGLPIQEAYGLTETSPGVCMNGPQPGANRLGTVGRPLDNLEVKLGADGELLVRGPSVTQGYWNKPAHTAEILDAEGFLHTGDIASIDSDGFVTITDRKKDIIVTAGGKNVAPQPIEGDLKQSRYVSDAVLIGDRQPYIVALLSPDVEALLAWAEERGLPHEDLAVMLERKEVAALFAGAVEATNAHLARFEQIKHFRVLPRPLTVGGGHLTPTMKVKRNVVEKEFADLVAEMYADRKEPVTV